MKKGIFKMKKVLKQIGKAIAYFAVYFTVSNVVTLIVSTVLGYVRGREYGAAGLSAEEGLALVQSEMNSLTGICLLVSAILALITYAVIEKVKKSNLAKETDMKKVSGKQLILTVTGALGAMFFMNFMLSILPIPEDLTGNLENGMQTLTSYPFWQAILANAIFVPIIEEVVFRGYIFNRLEKAMPSIVAALISSAAFGIAHGGLVWAVWAFALGMIICVVRIKSGSIIPGIIFHIIMNTYAMVVSYFPVLDKLTKGGMIALTVIGGLMMAVYIAGILTDKENGKEKAEVKILSSKA